MPMKSFLILVTFGLLTINLAHADSALKTDQDKISYALGNSMGKSLQKQGIIISETVFLAGLKDGLHDSKPLLTLQAQTEAINKLQAVLSKKAAVTKQKFLAANAKLKGVKTTESGLQYKIIKKGSGPKPISTDKVMINYEGKFIDGTLFDSTIQRGKPATIILNEFIPGLVEAIKMMPVGSTWIVYVPPKLTHGPQQIDSAQPEQTLIFKIHLIKIAK